MLKEKQATHVHKRSGPWASHILNLHFSQIYASKEARRRRCLALWQFGVQVRWAALRQTGQLRYPRPKAILQTLYHSERNIKLINTYHHELHQYLLGPC